jgi:uncharacterized protein (UPF0333 family)
MNIGSLIFAAVILAMVIAGSLFVLADQNSKMVVSDTYGNMPTEAVNTSVGLVQNVTNVGVMAGGGMFMIMALLVVGCAVGGLIIYGKTK